jgi:ribokinase
MLHKIFKDLIKMELPEDQKRQSTEILDFIAIGDTVTDAFIKLKEAEVHTDIKKHEKTITMKFGQKVPYENATILYGVGNAANAAVSASRLGLRSGLITNMGQDEYGKISKEKLEKENLYSSLIELHPGTPTNYHYVLWYKDERTILVKHYPYNRNFNELTIPKSRYAYLTSLGADALDYHQKVLAWLKKNRETKLIFQPGTFQMQVGLKVMLPFYELCHVFVCNVEEAMYILNEKDSEVKNLMAKLHKLGPEIVLVTDGPAGAHMLADGKNYFMPIYPDIAAPYERTGAGDAFASTFAAALALGKSPVEALEWAPINSMNVVQKIGAQEGLQTKKEIEKWLVNAPTSYRAKEI